MVCDWIGGLEEIEFKDHLDYSIVKIGQNTEENLGDLQRLSVAQIPGKYHQPPLVGKTLKEGNK